MQLKMEEVVDPTVASYFPIHPMNMQNLVEDLTKKSRFVLLLDLKFNLKTFLLKVLVEVNKNLAKH
jgi:hypothetical protein